MIMLKKRSRSIQKDQQMGQIASDGGSEDNLQHDVLGQRQKTNSFFNVPGLFVGLTPKTASDCDSVRSPTSPLDFKLFCNLGSCLRYPKSSHEGNQKCWECHRIGLGSIVDSLDEDDRNLTEKDKVIPSSNSRTILFGSQIRSKGALSLANRADFCKAPRSFPENYSVFPCPKLRPSNLEKGSSDVLFEIGGDPLESDPYMKTQWFSFDSKRLSTCKRSCFEGKTNEKSSGFSLIGASSNGERKLTPDGDEMARSLTPEEIKLSEDYTCVISYGPNPKTTHIFGDCVLECHPTGISLGNRRESLENPNSLQISAPSPFPSDDFLSFCYLCKKKLEEGKDIYMYRGEKAFCSWDCRLEEISIEEQENSITEARGESPSSENGDDIFEKSMFIAI